MSKQQRQMQSAPEFSRTFAVAELSGRRREVTLEASEPECRALAERFEVARISNLTADVLLTPFSSGNKVLMRARFSADVEQACVVTLEPVASRVEGEFSAEFVPPAFLNRVREVEFDVDEEEEPPEPIVDGRFEVGELIAQHLGLAIDPFPRAPGAEFATVDDTAEDEAVPVNSGESSPFAVLERLKSGQN